MHWKLAFRNVFRHRTRSIISILSIASGVIAIILAGGFMDDSIHMGQESYIREQLGHIRIYQTGYDTQEGRLHPFDFFLENYQKLSDTIQALPHVRYVAPRVSFGGLLSSGDASFPVVVDGLNPEIESADKNNARISQGKPLLQNSALQVILGKGAALTLGGHVGDSIVLVTNTQRGALNALDLDVVGIFETMSKAYDDHAVRVSLGTAQKLLRTDQIQMLVVFLDKTENTDSVKAAIAESVKHSGVHCQIKAWHELEEADFVLKVTIFYRSLFGFLMVIIVGVVTLGITNTMNMAVLERVGEIGTLSAIGTRPKGIVTLFLMEGFFLGIFGGLAGSVLGCLLAAGISQVGIPMPTAPGTTIPWVARIAINVHTIGIAFGLALITAIVSAMLPAIKASRLETAEALRHNV